MSKTISMEDKDLIRMAEKVPYTNWWYIEAYIEKAESPEAVEKMRWIMRKKELLEQYNANR